MLRLVRKAHTAPCVLACALVCATAACGAEEPQRAEPPASAPAVRSSTLAIQRRPDGLEQINLRGRPQHVTVARTTDAGLQRTCAAHDEQGTP